MLYSIVGMLVIILDQLVKFAVDRNINWTNPTRTLIPGVLSLVRVQNDGAAFSFLSGSGARIWFIVITGIFAVLVVLALATNFVSGKFGRWCLVFITAGGLANMIDRIRYGYVIDMFKIELFDFAVFNVADIFITVFCIAFIIYILFGGEKQKEADADEFDDYDYEEEDRPARSSLKKPAKARTRYEDDDEEDRRASRRKASKKQRDYEDEDEEDYEEAPRRKSERSAAAAAKAYSRKTADEQENEYSARKSVAGSTRSRTAEDEEPVRKNNRKTATEELETRRPVSRRNAGEGDISSMFADSSSSAATGARNSAPTQRTASRASASARPERQASAVSPARKPASVSDANNPFAEWEQANQRVSSDRSFNNLQEEPKATARAESSASRHRSTAEESSDFTAKSASKANSAVSSISTSASDDFDLDAILNEFK